MREPLPFAYQLIIDITHCKIQPEQCFLVVIDFCSLQHLYIGDSLDESLTAEAAELFDEIPTTIARRSPSPSRAAQMRSLSPVRGRSPAVADNTLAMVQSAIHKRGLQVQVRGYKATFKSCTSILVILFT